MRVDLTNVLTLMGVQVGVLPAMVTCPICGASGKCLVKHATHIICQACWFSGDVVMLYAKATKKTILEAYTDLKSRAFADLAGEAPARYASDANWQFKLTEFMVEKIRRTKLGHGGGAEAILDKYNCRFDRAVADILPHAFPFFKADLEEFEIDVPPTAKATITWLKNYAAWALPVWNGPWIGGFWLITVNGHAYLPLQADGKTYNSGTAAITPQTTTVLVTHDPIEALRFGLWSILHTGKLLPVIVPASIVDTTGDYKVQNTIFWSPESDTEWIARAMLSSDCLATDQLPRTAEYMPHLTYPYRGDFDIFTAQLKHAAVVPHKAIVQNLLRLEPDKARESLAGVKIDQADRAKIMTHVPDEHRQHIQSLLHGSVSERAATLGDAVVTENNSSWLCKGKVISSAVFYMDEVRPHGSTGEATITGTISYAGNSFTFKDLLSVMRKKPGDWLERQMVSKFGRIPMIDRAWSARLFDVSQAFKQPVPIMESHRSVWVDGLLRLPRFTVDKHGVYPSANVVDGPNVPVPSDTPDVTWMTNDSSCRIWLALAGNIVRAYNGVPGHGLLFINKPNLIYQMAKELGCTVYKDPSDETLAAHRDDALPLFTDWSEQQLHRAFNKSGCTNMVLSVSGQTAALAQLVGQWQRVDVGIHSVYTSYLQDIFSFIPKLINEGPEPASPMFYRKLSDLVKTKASGSLGGKRCAFAQAAAEYDVIGTNHSLASKLMLYLTAQATAGRLPVTESPEGVVLKPDDVGKVIANPHVPVPGMKEVVQVLTKAGFCIRSTPQGLTIGQGAYSFYASTAKAVG